MTDSGVGNGDPTNCKVGHLIEKYDLHDVGDEMVSAWRGDDGERTSLRTLADRFNRSLLERSLEAVDRHPLDDELETWYRLLTDCETSPGDRTQTTRRLERLGVDVECLRSDFVSYQAIRTYLKTYRGISYDEPPPDPKSAVNAVRKLQTRLERVAVSRVERLAAAGLVDAGSLRASADVHIVCEECDTRCLVGEFVDGRGCECNEL